MTTKFCRALPDQCTRYLFVGNCGPAVGIACHTIQSVFQQFGDCEVCLPGDQATHVYIVYKLTSQATAAVNELHGRPCPQLGGRQLAVKYADIKIEQLPQIRSVAVTAEELAIPGLQLLKDFVNVCEEAELLSAVDARPWTALAKRRVQHYGYSFDYVTRNVDVASRDGPLPEFVQTLLQRLKAVPGVPELDQMTVNEYEPGVGLSAHIDTHSAFTGAILSLSLAGPCVMELRQGDDHRPLFLPPRSLLILADEARYCWQHYIPHRKSDVVDGATIPRAARRVSFTFRQVRGFPCTCPHPQFCDSQLVVLPPTRLALLQQQQEQLEDPASKDHNGQQCESSTRPSDESRQQTDPCTSPGHQTQATEQLRQHAEDAPQPSCSACTCGKCPTPEAQHVNAAGCPDEDSQAPGALAGTDTAGMDGHHPAEVGNVQRSIEQDHVGRGGSGGIPSGSMKGLEGADEAQSMGAAGTANGDMGQGRIADAPAGQEEEHRLRAVEEQFVHKVYDAIAGHFSATRFAVWPRVREFIDSLEPGSVVADVGCGNGKYLGVRRELAVIGTDRSTGLVEQAALRLHPPGLPRQALPLADAAVADAMALPFRPGCCDAVLCIAVLHHISSHERRLKLLRQLMQVLRAGGRALVTVWALQQEDPGKTLKRWQPIAQPADALDQEQVEPAARATAKAPSTSLHNCGDARHMSCMSQASHTSAAHAESRTGVDESQQPLAEATQHEADPRDHGSQHAPACSTHSRTAEGLEMHQESGYACETSSPTVAGTSTDYLVPWHVPLHRAEAHSVLSNASQGGSSKEGSAPTTRVDNAKQAVVLQRYYHLFDDGELDALAGELVGVRVLDSFFDKSNWCVILEKIR